MTTPATDHPRRPPISEWKTGDDVTTFARLADVKHHPAKKQGTNDRWTATVSDRSGRIDAVDWEGCLKDFPIGWSGYVALVGLVDVWRESLQLKLRQCREVDPKEDARYGFDPDDLILASSEPLETLLEDLEDLKDLLKRPDAVRCWTVLWTLYGDRFQEWPAAVKNHHAFRRGLLEHSLRMGHGAVWLSKLYGLDLDVLLLGVLAHDLGKVEELGPMPGDPRTLGGELFGHISLGLIAWRQICELAKPEDDLAAHVAHLVLSHHGKKEYGSPVPPATAEAHALHHLDMLDCRIQMHREATRDHPDGVWVFDICVPLV